MKIDLHVHTTYSDGLLSPKEVMKTAKKAGMAGIAICDHNEVKGHRVLLSSLKKSKDFVVIPGIEVSSSQGHILGLGIDTKIRRDLEPQVVIERINDLGGVAVIAHPGKKPSGIPFDTVRGLKGYDALEVYNGRAMKCHNIKAEKLADKKKKAMTGGSDGHTRNQIGRAYTIFKTNSFIVEDLLEDIRKRRTSATGRDIGFGEFLGDNLRILRRYAGRGFKKI